MDGLQSQTKLVLNSDSVYLPVFESDHFGLTNPSDLLFSHYWDCDDNENYLLKLLIFAVCSILTEISTNKKHLRQSLTYNACTIMHTDILLIATSNFLS